MNNNAFLQKFEKSRVRVIAVSKTKQPEQIKAIYDTGHKDFGENKAQELQEKFDVLPKDIKWHMIGHLQRNKVKYIAPFVHLIHSADSLRLIETIDKEAKKNDRIINVLLQVKISGEETKFGLESNELYEIVEKFTSNEFPNVKICGLMGMASLTDNDDQIDEEFALLQDLFIELKEVYFKHAYYFKELSMGMSSDYEIAIDHGATFIRIGTLIFGQRY